MKASLNTQSTITKALSIAVLFFFLLPSLVAASGGHHSGKRDSGKQYSFKEYSGKHTSGKQCQKQKCDTSLSVPLYVNGDKRVGKVTVRLEQSDLKVTYQVDKGWTIKSTSLDVADSYNGLHLNNDGSPRVDAFPYKTSHYMPVKSAQYIISARQWPLGTSLYLSAQAEILSETGGKCQQRTASTRHHDDHEKFSIRDEKHDSRHGNRTHHEDRDDDEHYGHEGRHHDESDDEHGKGGKSISNVAWAVGELFPGQKHAAYFTYTLKSCDNQQESVIQFSDAIYTVNENDAQVLVTVMRSGNLDDAASVSYTTIDGSAISGVDYVYSSGVVNFAPGQNSAQFAVAPIDDTIVEDVESLTLQLSNPVDAVLGQQSTAILEIQDNDVAPATVIEFSAAQYSALERVPFVTVTVVRSGDLNVESQVDFTTADGTATLADNDYVANSGTLVFPVGVDTITFKVMIINDRNIEPDETVLLQLSNPVGAELGAQNNATLFILNDDGTPT